MCLNKQVLKNNCKIIHWSNTMKQTIMSTPEVALLHIFSILGREVHPYEWIPNKCVRFEGWIIFELLLYEIGYI